MGIRGGVNPLNLWALTSEKENKLGTANDGFSKKIRREMYLCKYLIWPPTWPQAWSTAFSYDLMNQIRIIR